MDLSINYIAVLVAALAQFVLGALWFGPIFGKKWMHLMKLTQADMEAAKQGSMWKNYLWSFIGSVVTAYVLSHFVQYFDATTIGRALQLAFWAWLGFVATFSLGSILWENKPRQLYVLTNAYNLLSLMVMAIIVALW